MPVVSFSDQYKKGCFKNSSEQNTLHSNCVLVSYPPKVSLQLQTS